MWRRERKEERFREERGKRKDLERKEERLKLKIEGLKTKYNNIP